MKNLERHFTVSFSNSPPHPNPPPPGGRGLKGGNFVPSQGRELRAGRLFFSYGKILLRRLISFKGGINKVMKAVIFSILIIGFFLGASPLYAGKTVQEVALGDNLERWNLPVFNMGVGQAYAADARAAQAGFTNPAAVSRIASNQFSVEYQRWGEGWDLVSAALAHPMRGGGAFSTQFTWLDYGELEPEEPDDLYRPQGNEFKAGLTYSQLLTDRLALGVTGNVMTSKIDFDYDRETAGSMDVGAIFRMTPDLWLGAVGKNINGSLKVDDKQNKLPPQYRAGVAWYLFQTRLGITADAVYLEDENSNTDDDQQIGVAGGLRFLYSPHVSLAVGYHNIYEDNDGMAGNLDFQFERFSFRLGYMQEENGNIIRTGGTVNF